MPGGWLPSLVELTAQLDLNGQGRLASWSLTRSSGVWQLDQQVAQIILDSAPYSPPPSAYPTRLLLRIGFQPAGLAYLYLYPGGY